MIRNRLNERFGEAGNSMRILYGGSVKAANAARIDGGCQCRWSVGRRRQSESLGFSWNY